MPINFTKFSRLAILSVVFFAASCSKSDVTTINSSETAESFSAAVPTQWVQVQLEMVRQTPSLGFTPPVASRTFGYTSIALYEAVVNGMPSNKSIASKLGIPNMPQPSGDTKYNWAEAANAAMAQMTRLLFVNATNANFNTINQTELSLKSQLNANGANMEASEMFGKRVAMAVYNWSLNDGGADGITNPNGVGFVMPTGYAMWTPTAPAYAAPLHPTWGYNRPFSADDLMNACMPPAPHSFSTTPGTPFYTEAIEVYNVSRSLTPEQTLIAKYWADGGGSITPPGHSMAIATDLIKDKNVKLGAAAELYAKLGMAVADAFIACWRGKYMYNVMRPQSFINREIDANWKPLITTPPFPEYCSGHSTQSGAAAEILTSTFGSIAFTDKAKTWDGGFATRNFTSFYQMAQEAAVSRLYGGIHFANANNNGYRAGIEIGKNINNFPFRK
jgi:hypothetical protein